MKKIAFFIFNLYLFLLLPACAQVESKNSRPDWVDNPGSDYVGQCGTHVRGITAQEQCAYKKGLIYIAMSKGVSVDINADMVIRQTSTEKTGSSFGKVQATVNMNQKDIQVNATIINKWHDTVADIMYVLIQENPM